MTEDNGTWPSRLPGIEARYQALVEHIPAVTYIDAPDRASSSLYMSPQVEAILGYAPEDWTSDPDLWVKLLHPEDRERVLTEHLRTNESGEPFVEEYRLMARDGRIVWIRDEAVLIRDEEGLARFWQGVMIDVTDRKRAEEQIRFLAYHDRLTGLPNRTMFEEALALALARARRHRLGIAVLFMDLDNFKLVNDSLGHNAGDELLREVASRLQTASREEDLVARQGGDEFLVLLADLRPEGGGPGGAATAEAVAGRIQAELRRPFVLAGTEVFVTASIGMSVYPQGADGVNELLQQADAAMYRSKRSAPGEYAFFSTDAADPLTKLSLSTRLRKATDREEWVLHYQPIVDLGTGRVVGVEALLRWHEPGERLMYPDSFLPVAEELGLMRAIGDWVIQEACRQAGVWRKDGIELEVAVNLSVSQLWQPKLPARLQECLAAAGVPPQQLVVEITESAAMTDPERTARTLGEMHEAGIRLAIDDFGTGYSSLSRLRQLPLDVLKIDRPFVRPLPADPQAASAMQAIVQLAHGLDMVPLAEGIETPEQRDFLVEMGCRLGQGYLFSPAVPPAEIPELVSSEPSA